MLSISESDYPSFYHKYVSSVAETDIFHYLEDQKSELISFLQKIPENAWSYRYAEGKWSIKQILGHICDSELIFGYRALCIARGETQSLPGFDQNNYVDNGRFDDLGNQQLLDLFLQIRDSNLAYFATFNPFDWENKGMANNASFTTKAFPFIMAGHVAHHMNIIRQFYIKG